MPKTKRLTLLRFIVLAFGLLLVLVIGALAASGTWLAPLLRQELSDFLTARTGHRVSIGSMGWSLWSGLRFHSDQLLVTDPEEEGGRPLLRVERMEIHAGLFDLLSKPRRIERLHLRGVQVRVPARGRKPLPVSDTSAEPDSPPPPPEHTPNPETQEDGPVELGRLTLESVTAEIEREDKDPRVIRIRSVELQDFSLTRPFDFKADVSEETLGGQILAEGNLGPWNKQSPGQTPLQGTYHIIDLNLSTFKGVGGLLASTGAFEGVVDHTLVKGRARVPDFRVGERGQAVLLEVDYEVLRQPDLIGLEAIEAKLLETIIHTTGTIRSMKPEPGQRIDLDVRIEEGRIENFIQLVELKDKPPLSGRFELNTLLDIPAGEGAVMDRLGARGKFRIMEGEFGGEDVGKVFRQIGQVVRLEPSDDEFADITADFNLQSRMVDLSGLKFSRSGMGVDLDGRYGLSDGQLDFRGFVTLERSPSELLPESLGSLGRLIDPFLRGRGSRGTAIPIRISGTRQRPSVALNF